MTLRERAREVPPCARWSSLAAREERRQLKRLAEVELADLARLDLGDDEVAALDRSAECCSRASVIAQVAHSILGPNEASSGAAE